MNTLTHIALFGLLTLTVLNSQGNPSMSCIHSHQVNKLRQAGTLVHVFVLEHDSANKDILKLYDDKSYEFLFFQVVKNKPKVKREKGTYNWHTNKLKLVKKGDSKIKPHAYKFLFDSIKGQLIGRHWFNLKKETNYYTISKEAKFWQNFYQDKVFGKITNDPLASRKIILPETQMPTDKELNPFYQQEDISTFIEQLNSDTTVINKNYLKHLKVVFVVGPVEESTNSFIAEQKINAAYLKNLGLNVIELYHPYATWKNVVEASKNAHIFVYNGHGSNQGINHPAGGLCLTDGIFHAREIINEFKLHKNALVLFNHVCRGAGSSAGDVNDIGLNEAIARVGEYAYPFVQASASAYYANNYYECLIPFFEQFFRKKSMKNIYAKEASKYCKIECVKTYHYNPSLAIGISSEPATKQEITLTEYRNGVKKTRLIPDFKSYDVAFVGKPDYTILDLFKN